MDAKQYAEILSSPAGMRRHLRVKTRRGTKILDDILFPFQRKALDVLDEAVVAVSQGRRPKHRQVYLEWCKGSSKTTLISIELLWLLVASQSSIEVVVGAGDEAQAREGRKVIAVDLLGLNPWLRELAIIQAGEIRKKDDEESRIVYIPSDSGSAHGGRPAASWADEWGHWGSAGGEEFLTALSENQRKTAGLFVLSSNAGFLGSWQFKRRESIVESDEWFTSKFDEIPPWIDEKELAEFRQAQPMQFARLYRGQWSDKQGTALAFDLIERAVRLSAPITTRTPGWRYVLAIDAAVDRDAFAIVVVRHNRLGHIEVCTTARWLPRGGPVDIEAVEKEMFTLHGRYLPEVVIADLSQCRDLQQRWLRRVRYIQSARQAPNDQMLMARAMISAFTSGTIAMPRLPDLIHDLQRMQIIEKAYGIRLETPRGRTGHGDLATALAFALVACDPRYAPSMAGETAAIPEVLTAGRTDLFENPDNLITGRPRGALAVHAPRSAADREYDPRDRFFAV
jgi:hypothetical protein